MQIIVWTGASSIKEVDIDIIEFVDGFKFGAYDKSLEDPEYVAGYITPSKIITDIHLASRNQFFIFTGEHVYG
jgi:hypothetical protein